MNRELLAKCLCALKREPRSVSALQDSLRADVSSQLETLQRWGLIAKSGAVWSVTAAGAVLADGGWQECSLRFDALDVVKRRIKRGVVSRYHNAQRARG